MKPQRHEIARGDECQTPGIVFTIKSAHMQDHISEKCKEITSYMVKDKLSQIFREPCHDPEYLRTIQERKSRSVDLKTVTENLAAKRYQSFEAWANDMILMFDNSIYFNQNRAPAYAGIAKYLKKKLLDKIERVRELNARNYEARILELTRQLNDLMSQAPPEFEPTPPSSFSADAANLEEFTKDRAEKLLVKLNAMMENGKTSKIIDVLKQTDEMSKIDEQNGTIDLALMKKSSLLALEKLTQ